MPCSTQKEGALSGITTDIRDDRTAGARCPHSFESEVTRTSSRTSPRLSHCHKYSSHLPSLAYTRPRKDLPSSPPFINPSSLSCGPAFARERSQRWFVVRVARTHLMKRFKCGNYLSLTSQAIYHPRIPLSWGVDACSSIGILELKTNQRFRETSPRNSSHLRIILRRI
jgi:hypothetical protein